MGLRARRICQTKVMALIVASSAQLIASSLMWCEARWKLLAVMIIAPNRTAESSAPGASNGEGSEAGCRGKAFQANSRAIVPGTRLMANNHCQRSTYRIVPPSTGAMAVLEAISRACSPRMRPSSRPGKTARSIAGAILSVAAPPIPCKIRIPISMSGVRASAQPSEVSVKTASPVRNTGR